MYLLSPKASLVERAIDIVSLSEKYLLLNRESLNERARKHSEDNKTQKPEISFVAKFRMRRMIISKR
jgi:hypothetical protein